MRLLVRGLLLAWAASPAFAGDIDNSWLRGSTSFPADPPTYRRWSGAYGGGQIGLDSHSLQFNDNGNARITTLVDADPILAVARAPILGDLERSDARGLSYGGFIGYNYQIDDTVLGLELNLNGSNINARTGSAKTATGALCPNAAAPCTITVNASNAATDSLNEYGTLRVRGGWAYGSFLPYVVVGVAVGWVDSVQTVNVNFSESNNPAAASYSDTANNHGKIAVGFSFGLGVDYAVYQNVFLRGEFEYLQFGDIGHANSNATSLLNLNAMSLRTGLGLKF